MVWKYEQSTGRLYLNGVLKGTGYSGSLTNKNNPDREHVKGMGPLPRGMYRIGSVTRSKGPWTIELHQVSGNTFGRDLFRIHGEKRQPKIPGFASEGCIIMGPDVRILVAGSTDTMLEVIR